jgi:uncharacterized oxidoreductase
VFLALDPRQFTGGDGWRQRAAELVEYVRETPRAPGVDVITIPGDPERDTFHTRCKNGIPIEDNHWRMLAALADRLHIRQPVDPSLST